MPSPEPTMCTVTIPSTPPAKDIKITVPCEGIPLIQRVGGNPNITVNKS